MLLRSCVGCVRRYSHGSYEGANLCRYESLYMSSWVVYRVKIESSRGLALQGSGPELRQLVLANMDNLQQVPTSKKNQQVADPSPGI